MFFVFHGVFHWLLSVISCIVRFLSQGWIPLGGVWTRRSPKYASHVTARNGNLTIEADLFWVWIWEIGHKKFVLEWSSTADISGQPFWFDLAWEIELVFDYTAIRVVLLQIFGVDVFLDCLELMLLRSVLLCVCVCLWFWFFLLFLYFWILLLFLCCRRTNRRWLISFWRLKSFRSASRSWSPEANCQKL